MRLSNKKFFTPIFNWLFVAFSALMLCSCTTTSFHSKNQEYAGENPVSAIYIYSFLDLREGLLGKKFLAEVKRQLNDSLAQKNIRTKQLWFNESPLSAQFSLEEKGPNPSHTTTRAPVDEVIKITEEEERSFGASHRLIVFPSSVMYSNTGSSFNIRWTLIDSKTNKLNWSTTSSSYHTKWFLGDENPVERADNFVKELMIELRKAGVISDHGSNTPIKYTRSSENSVASKPLRFEAVRIGTFSASSNFDSRCRFREVVNPPSGESFESYIQKTLAEELRVAGKYSNSSNIVISGNIDSLSFNSSRGITGGAWDIGLRVYSTNGKSFHVTEHYEFEAGFDAYFACQNVADEYKRAVRQLIDKIIYSPELIALTQ